MGVERKNNTYRYQLDNTNTARQFEYDFDLPVSEPGPGSEDQKAKNAARRRQRRKRRQKARIRAFVTALIIIAAFGGLALKAAHVHLVKGTQIRILQEDIEKLKLENSGLQRDIDSLSSLRQIEQAALAMGMEKPEGTIYVDKSLLPAKAQAGMVPRSPAATEATKAMEATEAEGEKNFLVRFFERLITVIT
jgi:cell division protein FtsL